eukprot:756845-Hanusia_phi.AAC.5
MARRPTSRWWSRVHERCGERWSMGAVDFVAVCQITMEGLLWGESQVVPIGSDVLSRNHGSEGGARTGGKRGAELFLQVSIDDLEELLCEIEGVQVKEGGASAAC